MIVTYNGQSVEMKSTNVMELRKELLEKGYSELFINDDFRWNIAFFFNRKLLDKKLVNEMQFGEASQLHIILQLSGG